MTDPTDRDDRTPETTPAATLTITVRLATPAARGGTETSHDPPPPSTGRATLAIDPDGADRPAYDLGFADGAAAGAALGRRLEALRWADEVARWRRLVRWAAAQRDARRDPGGEGRP